MICIKQDPYGREHLEWRQAAVVSSNSLNPWIFQQTHITKALFEVSVLLAEAPRPSPSSLVRDRQLCSSPCECLLPVSTPLQRIIPLISSISLWAVVYFRHQMPDEIFRRCVLGNNPYK